MVEKKKKKKKTCLCKRFCRILKSLNKQTP